MYMLAGNGSGDPHSFYADLDPLFFRSAVPDLGKSNRYVPPRNHWNKTSPHSFFKIINHYNLSVVVLNYTVSSEL